MTTPQLTYVEGDLFEQIPKDTNPGLIVIPHVCNNEGAWGKGFVLPLAEAYPDSRTAYIEWSRTKQPCEHPSPSLGCKIWHFPQGNFGLGQVQFVEVMPQRKVHDKWYPSVVVCNMVAQKLGGKRPLYYTHLVQCMLTVRKFIGNISSEYTGDTADAFIRIKCPMFGSGLAGGTWQFIEELIVDCWMRDGGYSVDVCYFERFLPEGFTPSPMVQQPTATL